MEYKVKLKPPMMPNLILFEQPIKKSSSIYKQGISVYELSRLEAEEYGELMKQTFIKHWEMTQINQKKINIVKIRSQASRAFDNLIDTIDTQ